jgi:rhomboid protease GluP
MVFNLFAMDLGARLVQRLYGAQRLLLWYLLGVIAASLASAIWSPLTPSVGASGGVFALFGVVLGAEWAHRPLVERGVRAALGQIGGLILINLLFGLGTSVVGGGIDNAAHIGGLVFGLLLGVFIAPTRAESMRSRWSGLAASQSREGAVTLILSVLLVLIFVNWLSLAQLRVQLPI